MSSEQKHFRLEELAEGVYAALGADESPTSSNAGIVDLGDQTLVFDAFGLPEAGRELAAVAEALTGRPATYLVNSHSHWDHWGGNQAFAPGVPIITPAKTRAEMPADSAWVRELQEDPDQLAQAIEETRARLATEEDARWRPALARSIVRMEHMLAALDSQAFCYPDLTFEETLTFHGRGREAVLVAVAPGHTVCDAYLLLPAERIAFIGDLGFFQSQPYMAFCDPPAWQAWLAGAAGWEVETFVPGHGPLGSRTDLALQRDYIRIMDEMVAQAVADGLSLAETQALPLSPPYDAWLQGGMARWGTNVEVLYERAGGGG